MRKRIALSSAVILLVAGNVLYYLYEYKYRGKIAVVAFMMLLAGIGILYGTYASAWHLRDGLPPGRNKRERILKFSKQVLINLSVSVFVMLNMIALDHFTRLRKQHIMSGPTAVVNATVVKVDSSSARNRGRYYINIIEYPTAKGTVRQDIETEGESGHYTIGTQIPVRYSLAYPDMYHIVQ